MLLASLGLFGFVTRRYWRLAASIHDVVNTLFWPTVFLIMAKCRVLFKNAK